jgi:putative DNA primase/helicase
MVAEVAEAKTAKDWLEQWCEHIASLKDDNDPLKVEVECQAAGEVLLGEIIAGKLSAKHVAASITAAAETAGLKRSADVVYPLFGLVAPVTRTKGERKKRNAAVEKMRSDAEDERPLVQIAAGQLARIADEAEDHLIAAGVPFYQRGKYLVRPVVETLPATGERKTQIPRLAAVDQIYMRLTLARHIRWEKFDKRSDDWVPADPTIDIAATINSRYGDWQFPPVAGIIGTQTMRRDGSLILVPGYDAPTGLILIDPPALPDMAEKPTRYDAQNALALLKELLAEFPFTGVGSLSVALSALITPVIRAALDTSPLHATTAPRAGTGKSYVFDVSSAISLGQLCPVIAAGKTEDEMEKRLGAALMSGQSIISIDNLNGELGGELLCQAVERPIIKPRILGKSESSEIYNRATFFATGNNLVLLDDMTRRAIVCSLDSGLERPELRQFSSKPAHAVLGERGPYIAACLTIARAYILAGKPGRLTPLASFEDWSDCVRSALVWLGEDDPCVTMMLAHDNDPVRLSFASFVYAWSKEIGTGGQSEMTAAELIKRADKGQQDIWRHPLLREALHDIIPEKRLNSKALGKWMARHENQMCGTLKLMKTADPIHGHRWYLHDTSLPSMDLWGRDS